MKQAIVVFLKKNKIIELIRKKDVPQYHKYRPHITLVYPFEINNQKLLAKHIKDSVKNIKPFTLVMKGLKKSAKDHYLYLLVKSGKKEIMRLYKHLNSGILKGFENKEMPAYIPHLTIGKFEKKKELDETIKNLKKKNIMHKEKIKSVQLMMLNKDNSLRKVKQFRL